MSRKQADKEATRPLADDDDGRVEQIGTASDTDDTTPGELPRAPRTLPVLVGVIIIVVVLWFGAGIDGALAAIAIGIIALAVPIPYVVAAAHVAFVAATADATLVQILVFEVGNFVLLLTTISTSRGLLVGRLAGATVIGAVILGGAYYTTYSAIESIAWSGIISATLFAGLAYTLHPYSVVKQHLQVEQR